jgi:hypothetical protein
MKKIILAIGSIIAVTLFSCTEKNTIGTELQPKGDKPEVLFDTSFSIYAYTKKENPVLAIGNTYNLVGSYTDPIFGQSIAGFYTQFALLSNSIEYGNSPVLDSMILGLAYSGYYGDISAAQTVKIYALDVLLPNDSIKSNESFSAGTLIGQLNNFIPNPKDSVFAEGKKRVAQLRITLDSSFTKPLFEKLVNKSINSTETLLEAFKGIKVIAEANSGNGAILYFNLLSDQSKINIHYKNSTDTLNTSLVISSSSVRANYFNELTKTSLFHTLPPSKSDSLLYLQSMARAKAYLKFPSISSIAGKYAINKAELILPVDKSSISGASEKYTPAPQLFLLGRDTADQTYIIDDQYRGLGYYGGSYNSASKNYTFNIAQHLQKILNGTIEDHGFYLITGGTAVSADRVVLENKTTNKISLKLTYTKLP